MYNFDDLTEDIGEEIILQLGAEIANFPVIHWR